MAKNGYLSLEEDQETAPTPPANETDFFFFFFLDSINERAWLYPLNELGGSAALLGGHFLSHGFFFFTSQVSYGWCETSATAEILVGWLYHRPVFC